MFKERNGPPWAIIELNSNSPASPVAMMSSTSPLSRSLILKNPVVKDSLNIWFRCRRHFGFKQLFTCSPMHPIHFFLPGMNDPAFKMWSDKGLVFLSDLFDRGTFLSFETLSKDFNIPKAHFFRYLQVRSFAIKHFTTYPTLPSTCPLEDCLHHQPITRSQISLGGRCLCPLRQSLLLL